MTDARPPALPTDIPEDINRWNWGAFLLNWIWGVGNNTYIALLTLVPLFGLAMLFILGAKGSAWAWRNGRWDSVEHFKRVQRKWAFWGVVIWLGVIVLYGGIFGGVFYFMKQSEAYQLAVVRLQANTEAVTALGAPISTGLPLGKISINGTTGQAVLSFSVTGTRATGRIQMMALKANGVWTLKLLKLKVDGRDGEIDLLKETRVELDRLRQRLL
ncbi:hypothetical protein CWS35_06865 [Bradyrhizobium sp. SK17]|uniref:cytochrome c oxidase assembly factor Coa1 family protein n=1 Tax=Bradyrhizobium sp. SK17 TaxID=2057741 RepID=UPI000C30C99F|nr:cytochrome c oxidase assembly factor Coa1 family protein [Bradyrhizobium sp. SK17]AUC94041.1 hypothetical protein CWS35_06865 [Bradyrhizobium sp. SK17]